MFLNELLKCTILRQDFVKVPLLSLVLPCSITFCTLGTLGVTMGTCTYIDRGRLLVCAPNGEKVALELGKPFLLSQEEESLNCKKSSLF